MSWVKVSIFAWSILVDLISLILDFNCQVMMMTSFFKAVVTVLWEYFTMALPDSDLEKSRDSILLLGMCGASEVIVLFVIFC